MYIYCENGCGYDSGDCDNIHILREKVYLDGGKFDYNESICPKCKCENCLNN